MSSVANVALRAIPNLIGLSIPVVAVMLCNNKKKTALAAAEIALLEDNSTCSYDDVSKDTVNLLRLLQSANSTTTQTVHVQNLSYTLQDGATCEDVSTNTVQRLANHATIPTVYALISFCAPPCPHQAILPLQDGSPCTYNGHSKDTVNQSDSHAMIPTVSASKSSCPFEDGSISDTVSRFCILIHHTSVTSAPKVL